MKKGWHIDPRQGIHLPQIGWSLDAHKRVERSFVSHAHFDHLARHREVLCTAATARLMQARLPAKRQFHTLPYGVAHALDFETSITLYPAGHVLGSAQSWLAHPDHGTLLYTGDFKLAPSLSAETCATPRADTLIMETTFGRSAYRFPPIEAVRAQVVRFCHDALSDGYTPVLLAYGLGKAQEVLCILGLAGVPVMLAGTAFPLTRIYADLGVALPPFREFDSREVTGHAVICPPHQGRHATLARIHKPRTAMITGWALDSGAKYRYRCDAALPLSDHADYDDLLRFVDAVQPRRVFTTHGFAEDFARTLRERGIEAWELGATQQLEFGPFLPSC